MSPEKAPAFQFYPKDFLMDRNVLPMTLAERGAYITLLCLCWMERSLPTELPALAKLCNVSTPAFTKLWPALEPCFTVVEGRLMQPRIEREREKQEKFRRRQVDAAAMRWDTRGNAVGMPGRERLGIATTIPNSCPRDEERRQKSSGSSEKGSGEKPDPATRAGALLEHYAEWYTRHRHGARLRLLRNAVEFAEACSLVEHWDDARLEKLATIVLTTDDAFISNTDRSFKIFALKASWADERLAAWEAEHGTGGRG